MNQVVIVSDSHGLTTELVDIKKRHPSAVFIHCGDSEINPNSSELAGYYKVGGNCDNDPQFPNEQIVTIGNLSFYITHGHLYQVKQSLMNLAYRAKEVQADIICFGHSHIAGVDQHEGQLYINPGSILLPRNRKEKTYAVMTWESKAEITVQFYHVNGEKIENFRYVTSVL